MKRTSRDAGQRLASIVVLAASFALSGALRNAAWASPPPNPRPVPAVEDANRFASPVGAEAPRERVDAEHPLRFELAGLEHVELELATCVDLSRSCVPDAKVLAALTLWRREGGDEDGGAQGGNLRVGHELDSEQIQANHGHLPVMAPPGPGARYELAATGDAQLFVRVVSTVERRRIFADERSARATNVALGEPGRKLDALSTELPLPRGRGARLARDLAFIQSVGALLAVQGEDARAVDSLVQAAASLRLDQDRDETSTAFTLRRRKVFPRHLPTIETSAADGPKLKYRLVRDDEATIEVTGPAIVDFRFRALLDESEGAEGEPTTATLEVVGRPLAAYALSTTASAQRRAAVDGQTRRVSLLSRQRLVVPPGRHRIVVHAQGALLVSATVRAKKYRLGESLTGRTTPSQLAKARRRARTPVGQAWAAALAWREDSAKSGSPRYPQGSGAALGHALQGELDASLQAAASVNESELDSGLAIGLVGRWAEMAAQPNRPEHTRRLAAQLCERFDPLGLVPEAAMLRALTPPDAGVGGSGQQRSRGLALALGAIRSQPTDAELRRDAQTTYWRHSTWTTLPTTSLALQQESLMVARAPQAEDSSGPRTSQRSLWQLPTDGSEVEILAPASPAFPSRPSLVTVRLHLPAAAAGDGLYALTVDGDQHHGLALGTYVRIKLALRPGSHTLRLDAAGATAFANVTTAPVSATGATVSGGTPPNGRLEPNVRIAVGDEAAEYLLPPGGSGLVRVGVRLTEPGEGTFEITLDGQVPKIYRARLSAVHTDHLAHPLQPGLSPTPRETVVLPIAAGHRRIAVRVLDGSALVSMALRRDAYPVAQEPAPVGVAPASDELSAGMREPDEAPLIAIARLSQGLTAAPENPQLRITRAHHLVDLGEYGLAQEDLQLALAAESAAIEHPSTRSLVARLENRNDPRQIDLILLEGRATILEPATLGLTTDSGALEPYRALAASARTGDLDGASQALQARTTPLARAFSAELAAQRGDPRMAARERLDVFRETSHWPLAYAAAADFLDVLALEDGYRDAGAAYGLAQMLAVRSHSSRTRTLAVRAGRLSAWKRISAASESAGFERLTEPRLDAPSENEALGLALLAPPWPAAEATYLWPGRRRVIREQVSGDTALTLQTRCQILRPSRASAQATAMVLRIDELRTEVKVAPPSPSAAFDEIEIPLAPGPHRIELELPTGESSSRCSVRALQDGKPLVSDRRRKWLTSRTDRPYEVLVGGPVTVQVTGRQIASQGRDAVARIEVSDAQGTEGVDVQTWTLPLPGERDPNTAGERSRFGTISLAAETSFLLPGSGPKRIRVVPGDGSMLVRVSLRQADARGAISEGGAEIAPAQLADAQVLGEFDPAAPMPARALGLMRAKDNLDRVGRFGTVTSDNRLGLDDIDDADLFEPRFVSTHHLDYRRELASRRLWLRIGPSARVRQSSAAAGGGRLALGLALPRARLRLGLRGEALVQPYEGRSAYSLRASAFIDRPTQLGARLELRPALVFNARTQSLNPSEVDDQAPQPQPRVYLRYVEDHPFVLSPELSLRWTPLQDVLLALTAQTPLNSDFRTLDRLDVQGEIFAVASNMSRVLPEFGLGYQASVRMADAHRTQTYLRSRVTASAGLSVWAKSDVRFSLGLRNALYYARPLGLRNVVSFYLRIDFSFGRGLGDYGPRELLFRRLKEQRNFAPAQQLPAPPALVEAAPSAAEPPP